MGRRKIERATAPEESIQFVKRELKQYMKRKELCHRIETDRQELLASVGIDPKYFHADVVPTPQMFPSIELPIADAREILNYLEAKEGVYIVEHSIFMMEDDLARKVMQMLYCERKLWEEIIQDLDVSRMTLSRARNRGLIEMALWADSYLMWKVQMNIFM